MAFVDEFVVNVALPAMEKDLAASLATMQWVVNAYTLCLAALLLTGGAAGDQFGRRKIFAIGTRHLRRDLAGLRAGLERPPADRRPRRPGPGRGLR